MSKSIQLNYTEDNFLLIILIQILIVFLLSDMVILILLFWIYTLISLDPFYYKKYHWYNIWKKIYINIKNMLWMAVWFFYMIDGV